MALRNIFNISLLCAVAMSAMAIPARRDGFVRTAADGTEQTVYLNGDEAFHYLTNADGVWLDETTLEPLSEAVQAARREQGTARRARIQRMQEEVGEKPNLAPHGLIVLVNFTDQKFKTPTAVIDSMLNGVHFTRSYTYSQGLGRKVTVTSEGSARQYFQDQSYGAYNPIFDIVGPVELEHDMAYYGENDYWGNDKRPEVMVREACVLADEEYNIDFTQYDNDDDGKVDFVYVIYAGYGEADGGPSNTIWPHQYSTDGSIDGKRLERYACGCELSYVSNQHDGIGTFCHEFSHVLGLPDLYSTNSARHRTLVDWDIMDYGPYNNDGNTPPSYSAYERFYMGWLTPRVLTDPEYVWLSPLNYAHGHSLMLCAGDEHNLVGYDPNPTTFYLLEARTKTGWDRYLPGGGMMITKVNYNYNKWVQNTVNNSSSSMGVDIIEATKNTSSSAGKATDLYPRGGTEFLSFEDHEITNIIQLDNGVIRFSYRGADVIEALDNIDEQTPCTKIMRDGTVYIRRNGVTYDVTGKVVESRK